MKKERCLKIVHIISLLGVILLFFLAGFGYIKDEKAYIKLPIIKEYEIGICLYREIIGADCPSCGLTRGFISIENLDFNAALTYNRVSILVYIGFIALGIFNILSIIKLKAAKKLGMFLMYYTLLITIILIINWLI